MKKHNDFPFTEYHVVFEDINGNVNSDTLRANDIYGMMTGDYDEAKKLGEFELKRLPELVVGYRILLRVQ